MRLEKSCEPGRRTSFRDIVPVPDSAPDCSVLPAISQQSARRSSRCQAADKLLPSIVGTGLRVAEDGEGTLAMQCPESCMLKTGQRTEIDMSQMFDEFVANCKRCLTEDGGPQGRAKVMDYLKALLRQEQFVDEYCRNAEPGLHVLYEDPVLGFQVLAHVNENARVSPPHDHGESWAIYGQATLYTDVTEWKRVDDRSSPGYAELRRSATYRLEPGEAGIYQNGDIHSVEYPPKACSVRVTGTDLDRIPRFMIDLKTGAVSPMTRTRAS
jgi:hypothetical protein